VNQDIAKKFSTSEGAFYFEVSAKNNTGIDNMLYTILVELPFFDGEKIEKNKLIEEFSK
jgi:hypothetical protein